MFVTNVATNNASVIDTALLAARVSFVDLNFAAADAADPQSDVADAVPGMGSGKELAMGRPTIFADQVVGVDVHSGHRADSASSRAITEPAELPRLDQPHHLPWMCTSDSTTSISEH